MIEKYLISESEIKQNQVQGNLADRPSQVTKYGGRAMTPEEVKAAYDKLPKLLAKKLNNFLNIIPGAAGTTLLNESLAAMILTGIRKNHTLKDLFEELKAGTFMEAELEKAVDDLFDRLLEEILQREEMRGKDGETPYIGQNGNWWAGEIDTGVKAAGKDGYTPQKGVDYFDGKAGEDGYTPVKGVDYFDGDDGYTPVKGKDYFDGKDGKTAYQYAQEAGYTGSESSFANRLAKTVVESVNGKDGAVQLAAKDVGADEAGTATSAVSTHDVSTSSHNDIRLLITNLTSKLNSLANSDDTTLDQLSEIVAFIKSNRTLIESVTTTKVNTSDIIDNLTTSATNKPLSAKQGVALKALIDAITVPTKTSQLTNDSGFLTQHQSLSGYAKTTDHYTKTESDNKYQVKGNYLTQHQDLSAYAKKTDIPSVPTKLSQLTNDRNFVVESQLLESGAEKWTFTLENGSTVTKVVILGDSDTPT